MHASPAIVDASVKLFHCGSPPQAVTHLANLARVMGLAPEVVEVRNSELSVLSLRGKGPGVVLDLATLVRGLGAAALREIVESTLQIGSSILLLATVSDTETSAFIREMTNGKIDKIVRVSDARHVAFPSSGAAFSRELSEQCYEREPGTALGLNVASRVGVTPVMLLGEQPAFTHIVADKNQLFIWSTEKVFDVLHTLKDEREFELATDEYIPAIIFLRTAFGERCWHSTHAFAGLVIDDPLLVRRYGFIDFPLLLGSARAHGYYVTLAFIPWNYWRVRRTETDVFARFRGNFGICAHGCDHTKNEFGSTDYEELLSKCMAASLRIEETQRRTGIEGAPLMVCPQEEFSLEALRAMADSGRFFGVVNTSCIPRNLSAGEGICGADLLLPAQDRFFGLPIFKRHYWKDRPAFAIALFLGKPAIMAEHHEFFREGSVGAERFAAKLSTMRADVEWPALGQLATGTYQCRRVGPKHYELRFFTDAFQVRDLPDVESKYTLLKRIEYTEVEDVTVNGAVVPFSHAKGLIRFDAVSSANGFLDVRVRRRTRTPRAPVAFGIAYHARVAIRRGLSEFRDNFLSRSPWAAAAAKFLMKTLRQTTH
jgi:hypothetical protein